MAEGSLVSWKGFHVGWFCNVFCKTPFMQKLLEFGCELWFVRKVCIIQLILQAHHRKCKRRSNNNNKQWAPTSLGSTFVDCLDEIVTELGLEGGGPFTENIVKNPTTFVSYTGRYSLGHTLNVLEQLDPDEYIWMDIFCVNQFAWTSKSRSPEMKHFKETFLDELQGQIKSIGKTVLILEKWNDMMGALEQMWVLWEIFNTAESGARLDVCLSPEQSQDFVENCLESAAKFRTIMSSLAAVDANKARAEDCDDRRRIFAKIQESGVCRVNNTATGAMRAWMRKQGMIHLENETMHGGKGGGGPSPIFLMHLAELFRHQGDLSEAEALHRQAVEKSQNMLSPESFDISPFSNNLATLLCDQGRLGEAKTLSSRALEKRKRMLGMNHPYTLASLNNLATVLKNQGNYEEAEPLYREALERLEVVHGPDHPDTLTTMDNLALLLSSNGKLTEAELLYQTVLEKRHKVLGPDHPDTLMSINGLATVLKLLGKYREAELLCQRVVHRSQKVLGLDHPNTLTYIDNLSDVLDAQGKTVDAASLLRYLLEKRKKVLGIDHPGTFASNVKLLTLWLQEPDKIELPENTGH